MSNSRRHFNPEKLKKLADLWEGQIFYYPTIGSTNEEARRQIRQALPKTPSLWLADAQVAGRGRLGRVWQAPACSGLLFTLALQTELPLNQAFLYSAALSLAIREAILEKTQIKLDLKWPNDLLRNGRKVAGILAEVENGISGNRDQTWLVLGCGLNVDITEEEFSVAELQEKATSLYASTNDLETSGMSREELMEAIFLKWQNWQNFLRKDPSFVREEWAKNLITLGRWVEVWQNGQIIGAGTANGVDENGALIVRETSGLTSYYAAGDVSVRLPDGRYSV